MNEDRYRRMEAVFHEAADLEGDERDAFLAEACAGDDELRRDVERLLAHDAPAGPGDALEPGAGLDLLADTHSLAEFGPIVERRAPHPERVGRYAIREVIAEGGMGVVYLAEQDHPRRRVALKLIRPGLFTEEVLRRFEFEAELLGRLQHPGIAQIHDAGEADTEAGRQPYFALEYVEGVELRRFADDRSLDTRERLRLLARICDAVHHAHQKGIVHRDLKPANILVVEDPTGEPGPGQPKILDFGVSRLIEEAPGDVSRLTRTGHVVGTVAYMSPEQARGAADVDTRSDVYSIGVIGFELLSGRTPLGAESRPLVDALRTIQDTPAPRLESLAARLRGDVSIIIGKALEQEPDRRYASAQAMADDIRSHLADRPIAARPPTLTYQLRRFVRRNKAVVAGAAVAVVCLIAGLVLALLAQREEARQRDVAERSAENARRSAYAAQIQAAHAYHAGGDTRAARQRLVLTAEDLRGWEWDLLATSLQVDVRRFPMSIGPWPNAAATVGDPRLPVALNRRTIRIFDLARETWTDHPLPGSYDAPRGGAVALLPGRRSLLWGDAHGRIGIHDLDGTGPSRTILEVDGKVRGIRVSRDGTRAGVLASRDGDPERGLIHVLDIANARIEAALTDLPFAYQIALNPDGSMLAAGMRDGRVVVREAASLRTVHDIPAHDAPVLQVAFDRRGRRLASASLDRMIRVWSVETGIRVAEFGPLRHPAVALAAHPDGERLVSGHADATVCVWNLSTGAELGRTIGGATPEPDDSAVLSLAFGREPDLVHVATPDGIRARHLSRPLPAVLAHEWGEHPYAYDAAFDPSGRLLITTGWSGTARIWDVATRRLVVAIPCPANGFSARFSDTGARLIISSQLGYTSHILRSHRADTLRLEHEREFGSTAPCGEFLPGGERFALAAEERLLILDSETLSVLEKHPAASPIRSLAVDPTGERLAYGTLGGDLVILGAGRLEPRLEVEVGAADLRALTWSPDGTRLAVGGKGDEARILDAETGEVLVRFPAPGSRTLFSFRYSPDGRRLLTGSRRVSIGVREADSGREILRLHGHDGYVHALALSPDGRVLATASGDNTVRIWDTRPLEERVRVRDRMRAAEEKVRPLVTRRLGECESLEAALASLRADETLDEIEKHAAWCLAHRASAGR